MTAARDPLGWIGSVLESKYRIDAFVGEGGFGCVYRGTHLRLGKPIAVKFLRPELASGNEKQRKFLVRFLAEGQILHDLSRATAGVVQAMDLGAAVSTRGAWMPFIVMEWVDGRTLADELRQRPTRSVGEAIALLEPLLVALEIAHELGVAHLDLKPPNVMLAKIGARETMKALDFGISKAMGSAEDAVAPGKSGIGTRVFTPAYGAPEQFDPGLGSTGPWTDVYALGLMLIEVVDGARPYGSDDPLVCRRRALNLEERPALRQDRALDGVIRRVLAVDPRNRYSNAGELRRELEARVDHARTPPENRGPRTEPDPQTAGDVTRTRRRWFGPVLLVVPAALAVAAVAWNSQRADPPIPSSAASAQSSAAASVTLANDGTDQHRPTLAPEDLGFVDRRQGFDWGNRCFINLNREKLGYAKAECDEGLKLNPSPTVRAQILFSLGRIAAKDRNTREARARYRESLALREDPTVRRELDNLPPD